MIRHSIVGAGFYRFEPFDRRQMPVIARVYWNAAKVVAFYNFNGQHCRARTFNWEHKGNGKTVKVIPVPLIEAIKHGRFIPLVSVQETVWTGE